MSATWLRHPTMLLWWHWRIAVPQTLEPTRAKLSDKGRLVIPAEFREAMGIKPGDVVHLELLDNELRISTFANRLKRTQERMRKYATPGKSAVDELIAERRREAQKEEDEYQAWKLENGAAAKVSSR
jgi:AbrB family looped-hinge helix DNA binding protein